MSAVTTQDAPALAPAQAEAAAATRAAEDEGPVYTVRNALEILNDERDDPPEIWGGLCLSRGDVQEIIGPSGIGKSRIVLNLAINQIFGLPFAGLQVYKERPLNWLIYGNENSVFRFRSDLSKMVEGLKKKGVDPRQIDLIGKHLFILTPEAPEDFDLTLTESRDGSVDNIKKMMRTIRRFNADVVVMDPWGAIIDGDELSDADSVRTMTNIRKVLTCRGENPVVAIIINHSRFGRKEMANAAGSEKNNYGKNSKKIFSLVRSVWNLRPGAVDDPTPKVEFIEAKRSNGVERDPRGVEINPETLLYEDDPDFNHHTLQARYDKAAKSGANKDGKTPQQIAEAKEKAASQVLVYVRGLKKPINKRDLYKWVVTNLPTVSSREKRNDLIKDMIRQGKLAEATTSGAGGEKHIWAADKMAQLLASPKGRAEYRVQTPPPRTPAEGVDEVVKITVPQ